MSTEAALKASNTGETLFQGVDFNFSELTSNGQLHDQLSLQSNPLAAAPPPPQPSEPMLKYSRRPMHRKPVAGNDSLQPGT